MITLAGIVLIGIGVSAAYWLEGKKFARRNAAGIEEFSSYGASLKIRAKEGAAGILAGIVLVIGIFMAVGGLFA